MGDGTVDAEAFTAHLAEAGDGPVVMVNLMKFKSPEHAQRFMAATRERIAPFLESHGAERLYAGLAGPEFCANEDWDLVVIVRYPSFEVVHRTGSHETIGPLLNELRRDTMERARLIVTTPAPVG